MTQQTLINDLNDLCAKAREVARARVWAQMSPEAPDAEDGLRRAVEAERGAVQAIAGRFPSKVDLDVHAIRAWREALEKVALPWEADESMPPRYVRRRASTGEVLALVDPHVGGFQANPHQPELIAYRATVGTRTEYGILRVIHGERPEPQNTIAGAKHLLDAFLSTMGIQLL